MEVYVMGGGGGGKRHGGRGIGHGAARGGGLGGYEGGVACLTSERLTQRGGRERLPLKERTVRGTYRNAFQREALVEALHCPQSQWPPFCCPNGTLLEKETT